RQPPPIPPQPLYWFASVSCCHAQETVLHEALRRPSQRLVHIHHRQRSSRLTLHQIITYGRQFLFRREQFDVAAKALIVALPCLVHGLGGGVGGAAQQGGALLRLCVAQQPGFGFLQCAEYRMPVVGKQLGMACVGGVYAGLDQRPVEEAPVNAQGHAAGLGAGAEQVRAATSEGADQTIEGEAGEEVGGGDTDARVGSGQSAFGGADIRPATQHITGGAGGNARLGFRQVARLLQQLDQGSGCLPGEDRDAVHGGADIGAQYRNGGTGTVELGARAHLVEQGAPAAVQ